jgi:uncharacterized protein
MSALAKSSVQSGRGRAVAMASALLTTVLVYGGAPAQGGEGRQLVGPARDAQVTASGVPGSGELPKRQGVVGTGGSVRVESASRPAQPASDAPAGATELSSRQIDFTSQVNGKTYRIKVSIPFTPAPQAGYPVLYVLDGDGYFGTFAEAVMLRGGLAQEISPAVVAGIGYPTESIWTALARRNYDFTPVTPDTATQAAEALGAPPDPPLEYGGADAFLRVIETEVQPRVAKLAPIDPRRSVLFGHSLGGLFVLYAVFTHPEAFSTYLALSPSIWWDHQVVLTHEAAFRTRVAEREVAPRIFIGVGSLEESVPKGPLPPGYTEEEIRARISSARMIGNVNALGSRLSALKGAAGFRVETRVFEGQSHNAVPFAALNPLLDFALPVAAAGEARAADAPATGPDALVSRVSGPPRGAVYTSIRKSSLYIPAKDGVKLAIDVYLPEGVNAGVKLPAILMQTRYYRSAVNRADPTGSCKAIPQFITGYLVKRGYAAVIVDVRGTGASFGTHTAEISDQEVKDGAAVVDWITAQPWSSGAVGATGISYLGTTSEMLLRLHHPAVKAVAPISAGYDFYSDLFFPGGVENSFFEEAWGTSNVALDNADFSEVPELAARVIGPCPVDADTDGALMRAAIAEHRANSKDTIALAGKKSRDTSAAALAGGWPSPYLFRSEIDAANVPLLSLQGWGDAGYARGGIDRILNTRSATQRLILAPGGHGLRYFFAPETVSPTASGFDLQGELLRFFDYYVADLDNGYDREPRVRWFTTGANIWRSAGSWPMPAQWITYCLGGKRELQRSCDSPANDEFTPGADADTGAFSRWFGSKGGQPVVYPERSAVDGRLLTYTSDPLTSDLIVTGSPVLTLAITNNARDADYFVYLEEVDASGRSFYVGEGELRASHGRPGQTPYRSLAPPRSDLTGDLMEDTAGQPLTLKIGLLPLAHLFAKGSRLRIAIAGSAKTNFTSPPLDGQRWAVRLGGADGSVLRLPVIEQDVLK